jgi:hypothetical protein
MNEKCNDRKIPLSTKYDLITITENFSNDIGMIYYSGLF